MNSTFGFHAEFKLEIGIAIEKQGPVIVSRSDFGPDSDFDPF